MVSEFVLPRLSVTVHVTSYAPASVKVMSYAQLEASVELNAAPVVLPL